MRLSRAAGVGPGGGGNGVWVMSNTLHCVSYTGSSSTELIEKLNRCRDGIALTPPSSPSSSSSPPLSTPTRDAPGATGFVILWGPPTTKTREVEEVANAIPWPLPVIGASTHTYVAAGAPGDARHPWVVVHVSSAYVSAHAGYAPLEIRPAHNSVRTPAGRASPAAAQPPGGPALDVNGGVARCASEFVRSLGPTGEAYFTGGGLPPASREGAHKVRYARPAFVLLFLPGLAAAGKARNGSGAWPAVDHDCGLVEALSARAGRDLPLFGGSAAGDWPEPKIFNSWVAVRPPNGTARVEADLVAGVVVECDLSFGFGAGHGFVPVAAAAAFHVGEGIDDPEIGAVLAPEHGDSRPPRYHLLGGLSQSRPGGPSEPADGPPPPPSLADSNGFALQHWQDPCRLHAITLDAEHPWHTLVVFEGEESLPNPSHRRSDGQFAFMRPVYPHSTLYPVTLTVDSAIGAPAEALNSAVKVGDVGRPDFALLINCRMRRALLGDSGPALELQKVSGAAVVRPQGVFGMYGDGETCPSRRGFNLHRNCTASALVIGSRFNREYEAAARSQLLSRVTASPFAELALLEEETAPHEGADSPGAQAVMSGGPRGSGGLFPDLDTAIGALTQAVSWHVRVFRRNRPGGACLTTLRNVGRGGMFEVARPRIDLSPDSTQKDLAAYKAFDTRKPVVLTKEQYLQECVNSGAGWEGREAEATAFVEQVEWLGTFPIFDRDEPVGTLSIAGTDARQVEPGPALDHLKAVGMEIANATALPIRRMLTRNAMLRAALRADGASGSSSDAMFQEIVTAGCEVLGSKVYLVLYVAEPSDAPGQLRPVGFSGPCGAGAAVAAAARVVPPPNLTLDATVNASERGVCGWVFERKKPFFTDDIDAEADGKGGRPAARRWIDEAQAEYAVPLIEHTEEGGRRVLGVLNAEAPPNILDRAQHVPLLESLAARCVDAIRQQRRERRQGRLLGAFLPPHVYNDLPLGEEHCFNKWGMKRKIITLLYADIRGYTAMASIVGERRMLPFLKEYYTLVADAIGSTGGRVDKFMGDGVLAIYGDACDLTYVYDGEPPADDLHQRTAEETARLRRVVSWVEQAVHAGLKISKEFGPLAERYLRRWRCDRAEVVVNHRFELGTLVHTGKPMVGLLPAERAGGTEPYPYLTYTALGADVNMLARIGNEVDQNTVWVTGPAREYLLDSTGVSLEAVSKVFDPHKLKGITRELQAFQVAKVDPERFVPITLAPADGLALGITGASQDLDLRERRAASGTGGAAGASAAGVLAVPGYRSNSSGERIARMEPNAAHPGRDGAKTRA